MSRILAVDDTPDNLALIESILEEDGYEIFFASDGISGLAQIEQSSFDLILLDIMMPGMDGYEVTRRIRQNSQLPYIPILLLTAHATSNLVEGLEAGADDFVRKPVDADELAARVRSLLRLKHTIDEREQLALQRQDFISHLTHDLRTPLVAADNMLRLFQKQAFGPLPAPMEPAIAAMLQSNYHLMQIVDTLLEVQTYEAGAKALNFIECDLWEIAQAVVLELRYLAENKDLTLKANCNGETDLEQPYTLVKGDPLELRRVITNLIGNAIKFTENGCIELRLKTTDSGKTVVLEVQDTGPGMSPQEKEYLFARFGKGKHKQSGSGLGLHLVHRIVHLHQGTIDVSSELGQGSRFIVHIPTVDSMSVSY